MLDQFMEFSEVLTGFAPLSRVLGQDYLDSLLRSPFSIQLHMSLSILQQSQASSEDVHDAIRERIVNNSDLNAVASQIIMLWYTGGFQDTTARWRFEEPAHYFCGLIWPIIGAHPPGLSGGHFGHWRYRPENI